MKSLAYLWKHAFGPVLVDPFVILWRQIFAPALRRAAAAAKLSARRWTLRKLRLLADPLEDRLHAAEVRLRSELSVSVRVEPSSDVRPAMDTVQDPGEIENDEFVPTGVSGRISSDHQPERIAAPRSFQEWEARRSGFAPVTKKEARRHRQRKTAREFDAQFTPAMSR